MLLQTLTCLHTNNLSLSLYRYSVVLKNNPGPYIRIERDNEIGGFGILLQGFMFTDATSTAVRVATPNTFNAPMNTFCHCSFLK